jgi:hypothetical protein
MRRISTIVVAVLLVAVCAVVQAQVGIVRYEGEVGGPMHESLAVLGAGSQSMGDWELWWFNVDDPDLYDIEVGTKFGEVKAGKVNVDLIGYGVWWPATNDWFLMPWATITAKALGGDFTSFQAEYVPVTAGAPWICYSSETRMMWKADERTSVGVAAHWWAQEGSPCYVHWGPRVCRTVGDGEVSVRYCPFGGGGDTILVTGCLSF